jgi:hypothetical protein
MVCRQVVAERKEEEEGKMEVYIGTHSRHRVAPAR